MFVQSDSVRPGGIVRKGHNKFKFAVVGDIQLRNKVDIENPEAEEFFPGNLCLEIVLKDGDS